MSALALTAACGTLFGCATGGMSYAPPTAAGATENTLTLNQPRDTVWDALVPALGKKFFVINNLDRSSGLINVSYNGDPERYVDCGQLTSVLDVAGQGKTIHTAAWAKADDTFEFIAPKPLPGNIVRARFLQRRQVTLDGRANIILEAPEAGKTTVTVSIVYVVKRDATLTSYSYNTKASQSDTVRFTTGQSAVVPNTGNAEAPVTCKPTGEMEKDLLSLLKPA